MTIFDENLILETINMIKLHNFDIRTVTLAVSLRDCISEDVNIVCDKIKFKLDKYAKNLVQYADDIERFKQQLEESGSAKIESLDPNTLPRSTIVMNAILKAMYFDNNLVEV